MSQGFTSVGVRRAPLGIVPGRVAAVAELLAAAVPGPDFHQRMHPQIQVVHGQVRPDVADLLLAGAPHLLEVVKVLFDGRAIGEGFEYRDFALPGIGAEEGVAAMLFLDQDNPNDTAGRAVGRQEGLVGFGGRLAVHLAIDGVPSTPLSGSFGQTDLVLAVLARPAARTSLAAIRKAAFSASFSILYFAAPAVPSTRSEYRVLGSAPST